MKYIFVYLTSSPTSGGGSVGIVRLRTKCHGVFFNVSVESTSSSLNDMHRRTEFQLKNIKWRDNLRYTGAKGRTIAYWKGIF
jgi:hypothetical protein